MKEALDKAITLNYAMQIHAQEKKDRALLNFLHEQRSLLTETSKRLDSIVTACADIRSDMDAQSRRLRATE